MPRTAKEVLKAVLEMYKEDGDLNEDFRLVDFFSYLSEIGVADGEEYHALLRANKIAANRTQASIN